jgi:hypothetical protein
MAKAKVLADRISISSTVLTDENIEKVRILAPSNLKLFDERNEDNILYEVASSEYNMFTDNGAVFKDGKTIGTISESIMELDKEDREAKIKTLLTSVLTRINAIEEQVSEYLENAEDLSEDVEFLD